jgi:succinate--hydroxymethylglutarate CoA-transferase
MINKYDTFIASSRTFSLVEPPHSQFKLLAEKILEEPELCNDPRFATNEMRVANRTELVCIISDLLQKRPRDHWLRKFRGVGCVTNFSHSPPSDTSDTHHSRVPFGPINNIKETFEHPQAKARSIVVEVEVGFPVFSIQSSEC